MWGGGVVEFAISFDGFFKKIYVIDIHHIVPFQTSGDTCPAAFYLVQLLTLGSKSAIC